MKVVYLKNNAGCKRGDVKEVSEGHFRNLLAPQNIAVLATAENINKIKNELVKQDKKKLDVLSDAKKMAEKVRGKKVEIKAKANESGKLYAAVSEDEIRNGLKRLGLNIGEAKIVASHLKEAGAYDVKVDFGHSISSNIKVIVKI